MLTKHPKYPLPSSPCYSVVVPFYNESAIAGELCRRIVRVMSKLGGRFELIAAHDGSRDDTASVLEQVVCQRPEVVLVDLRRNFGQTTALQAGLDQAGGDIIVAMAGDLQHDPYEIPLLLHKLREGYDIISGWRVRRGDGSFLRRLPSRVANWLLSKVSGVNLHDFGTTFKAYRHEVLDGVRLYGDMHRFVPAVCARLGARIAEVPIKNVRRPSGKSNYGISRTFRVALDILTVRFISKYMTRPLHCFGKWGLLSAAAGLGILGYLLVRKLVDLDFGLMRIHGPLLMLGFLLLVMGMLFLATGLVGEMIMRTYFEATKAKTYSVRRILRQPLDRSEPPVPATKPPLAERAGSVGTSGSET